MTFINTNVLLDLVTDDPIHADGSLARLEEAALRGLLVIGDVVCGELSVRYERIEDLDAFVAQAGLRRTAMPDAALVLAGKAFRSYRRSGGTRVGVLPDFFVGAQAALAARPLLTRDVTRYRTYFPSVELIAP
ncbi:PIN domain-containing protein [uncultured Jannaschia sp.]|uniref:type II toxin-antitoxin system VapC family toxin n=1 Tax=uncultured Jannaschia sp. TaxID=293347 RepID=UPI00262D6615|nr:PIN domain-containing protein [uncultured Jannaschia sp.]